MGIDDTFTVTPADGDKKRLMPLLLIGDESEAMIDRYLDSGTLFVGALDGEPIAVCVAVDLDPGTVEIKNLAVVAEYRRHGIGRRMLQHVESLHQGKKIILGTGETPSTLRFYGSCGYSYSHRIPNFFTDNYPTPIIEEGTTLRDMIYLEKNVFLIIYYLHYSIVFLSFNQSQVNLSSKTTKQTDAFTPNNRNDSQMISIYQII